MCFFFLLKNNLAFWRYKLRPLLTVHLFLEVICPFFLADFKIFFAFNVLSLQQLGKMRVYFYLFFSKSCSDFRIHVLINFEISLVMISLNTASPFSLNSLLKTPLRFALDLHILPSMSYNLSLLFSIPIYLCAIIGYFP